MCVETDGLVQLCEEHVAEQVAAFYAAHPGIEQFHAENKGRCSHCVAMDMDDEFGPGVGTKWRNINWLLP